MRKTNKTLEEGINIHDQLFTIHTPSGEIIHIPVFRHPLNGKPVSVSNTKKVFIVKNDGIQSAAESVKITDCGKTVIRR